VRISVDNDGRETEHFSLAQAGGCSSGEFLNIGDDQFVKDGDTKAIDFPICINQEGISGRFTPGASQLSLPPSGTSAMGNQRASSLSAHRR
jgi:hypothetical protein